MGDVYINMTQKSKYDAPVKARGADNRLWFYL